MGGGRGGKARQTVRVQLLCSLFSTPSHTQAPAKKAAKKAPKRK